VQIVVFFWLVRGLLGLARAGITTRFINMPKAKVKTKPHPCTVTDFEKFMNLLDTQQKTIKAILPMQAELL
jgi:hypothetical protein